MSCWSLESLVSFMIMAGAHPEGECNASEANTTAVATCGSLSRLRLASPRHLSLSRSPPYPTRVSFNPRPPSQSGGSLPRRHPRASERCVLFVNPPTGALLLLAPPPHPCSKITPPPRFGEILQAAALAVPRLWCLCRFPSGICRGSAFSLSRSSDTSLCLPPGVSDPLEIFPNCTQQPVAPEASSW